MKTCFENNDNNVINNKFDEMITVSKRTTMEEEEKVEYRKYNELKNQSTFNDIIKYDDSYNNVTTDESITINDDFEDEDIDNNDKIDDVIKVFVTEKDKLLINNDDVVVSDKINDNLFVINGKEIIIKNKKIDKITDTILKDLLNESLSFSNNLFIINNNKRSNYHKLNNEINDNLYDIETPFITALKKDQERDNNNFINNITDCFIKKSINDATDKILKIYNKKNVCNLPVSILNEKNKKNSNNLNFTTNTNIDLHSLNGK